MSTVDLSIIIPSRSPQYLQRTIDDLIEHAESEIEIIVVFDGIWHELKPDPRVRIIKQGIVHDNKGMREGINAGVSISRGKYIMKTDEHCSFSQGFDKAMIEHYQEGDVVIPIRGRLDAEKWEEIIDGRPNIYFMSIDYPYQRPGDKTCGLHGAIWNKQPNDEIIEETPTMQGSCYFMSRNHWDTVIGEMSTEQYGEFTGEAQEISMKTWFSGGRCVVNKKAKYLHFHKGRIGKGYGFSNEQYEKHKIGTERGRLFAISHWTTTKDYKYDFDWFINEKFPNMPTWMSNWREQMEIDKAKDYSVIGQSSEAKIK